MSSEGFGQHPDGTIRHIGNFEPIKRPEFFDAEKHLGVEIVPIHENLGEKSCIELSLAKLNAAYFYLLSTESD